MELGVIRRRLILFFFTTLWWAIVSNAFATNSSFNSKTVAFGITKSIQSSLYALMSQEARDSSSVKTTIRKNIRPAGIPVPSNKDWRDVDWKDPFAPKAYIELHSQADVTITLEQNVPPPPSSNDSYDELADPFAPKHEAPEISDPFEAYNRFMFGFNESVYENVLEPVAEGYRDVVGEDIRMALSNLFSNALAPVKLISSFLQGDLDKTSRVIGRTIINTTLGIGGLFDVAKTFGIESVNEDLDQAFAYYGIPSGPYIMLPLLGPSTLRGLVGQAGGSFLSPTFHFAPGLEVGAGITMTEKINDASFILDDKKQLEKSTVDEYESMKDFYNQYRYGLVNE